MDKAISYLQQKHPWLTYAEGFALVMDSYRRNKPANKYSGMTKTLICLLYTSPSPRDRTRSRMPSSA